MGLIRRIPPLVLATLAASLLALGACSKSSTAPGTPAAVSRNVTVTVRDSLGAVQANAQIMLHLSPTLATPGYAYVDRTNASGELTIQLEDGAWTASARAAGMLAASRFTVPGPTLPPSDFQPVRLVLRTPSHAIGVARLAGRTNHRHVLVRALAVGTWDMADSSGAYRLELPPGKWDVTFVSTSGDFAEQILKVRVDWPGSTVTLPPVVLIPAPAP